MPQDCGKAYRCISTHALREEGDVSLFDSMVSRCVFLPTPSARRATLGCVDGLHGVLFLPTPSARRATARPPTTPNAARISTHALREEGDVFATLAFSSFWLFLPTPSARRATDFFNVFTAVFVISTHALREEGDSKCAIK